MEIQKIAIDKITPAGYNPRKDLKPGDPEYDKLEKVIGEFDLVEPLIWNKRTGNLVGGHQRLKILQARGDKEVEVSVVDLLQEIDTGAFDMDLTGFGQDEIEKLMTQYFTPEEGLTDDDAVPEEVEAICKPGDLWKLGNHRLLCGDATVITDVERLMGGEKADMVFTDPPYNVDYGSSKNPRHKIRKIQNDNLSKASWEQFCKDIYAVFKAYNIGDIYMWGASGPDAMRMRLWLIDMGCHWSATIVWKKQQLVLSPAKYQRMYEPCFYGWFGKSSFGEDRTQTEVWDIDRPLNSELHPTQKPVALAERAMNNSSKINQIVLDLFLGSGSTLIACEKLNRRCYGMEIDPHYCDVIIKRWEDYTGKKAELIE